MPRFAFKEWAAVCQALAAGRQSVILRKGGIAEEGGTFRPDHAQFWLFPTYLHQSREGLKSVAADLLADAERDRPPTGVLRLTHYVEVPAAFRASRIEQVLGIDRMHILSEATVRLRFEYRGPGLYVLPARVFSASHPIEVPDLPEYEGCKTWVDLGDEQPVAGVPVLSDREFADVLGAVVEALEPQVRA